MPFLTPDFRGMAWHATNGAGKSKHVCRWNVGRWKKVSCITGRVGGGVQRFVGRAEDGGNGIWMMREGVGLW